MVFMCSWWSLLLSFEVYQHCFSSALLYSLRPRTGQSCLISAANRTDLLSRVLFLLLGDTHFLMEEKGEEDTKDLADPNLDSSRLFRSLADMVGECFAKEESSFSRSQESWATMIILCFCFCEKL